MAKNAVVLHQNLAFEVMTILSRYCHRGEDGFAVYDAGYSDERVLKICMEELPEDVLMGKIMNRGHVLRCRENRFGVLFAKPSAGATVNGSRLDAFEEMMTNQVRVSQSHTQKLEELRKLITGGIVSICNRQDVANETIAGILTKDPTTSYDELINEAMKLGFDDAIVNAALVIIGKVPPVEIIRK